MSRPVRLAASLKGKPWGRESLQPWFADCTEKIGEAWFEDSAESPLLIKLIFTSGRLSVQLHPDDGEGVPRGKTEMWHILSAEPGAKIALGFREPITRELLRTACRSCEIEALLNWIPVSAGETYFTPAHTVHAIGAGIVLCEIQQNSDVTYRLWDYGSGRELHVEQALPLADLGVHPGKVQPMPIGSGGDLLVYSKFFVTELLRLEAGQRVEITPERCQTLIWTEGYGVLNGEEARPGDVWRVPESGTVPVIEACVPMRVLRTYVPR